MSKELVISSTRHETRVALIEDDQVVEVYHQRENEYSLAGSIHKGRVTRVLPGMQSAFVDIGLGRDAFLYVSDFFEDNEEYDKIVTSVEEKVLKLDRTPPQVATPEAAPLAATEEAAAPEGAPPEPVAEAAPPAAATAAAPYPDQRRDDRDRRGHRSRRRRGQKGGRGLPESKFYSPRPDPESAPEARPGPGPRGIPVETAAPAPEADDLFVLPGESLAKYPEPGGAGPPPAQIEEEEGQPADPGNGPSRPPQAEEPKEPAAELEMEPGPEPGPEPDPEPDPVPVPGPEPVPEPEPEPAPIEAAPEPVEAAGPEAPELELEPAAAASAEAEPVVEEEGPEPARIPTSLTATLREQGPRYLHRVSRRTRRKGREGRPPGAPPMAEVMRPSEPGPGGTPAGTPTGAPAGAPTGGPAGAPTGGPASAPSISDLPRSRWARRAPASLRTSRCRGASWSTCRPWTTSAYHAKSRATTSAPV
jgi:ribonuclease G